MQTLDRKHKRERTRVHTDRAERTYEHQLRKVASTVHDIILSVYRAPTNETGQTIGQMLAGYAEALVPWATRTARHMLSEVDFKSRDAFRTLGNEISFGLRQELEHAPTGARFADLMAGQVQLIQSIPLDAAERVHGLVREGLIGGKRRTEVEKALLESGEVAKSRAILIARTETSRAATTFVQARAEYVGSTNFIWHSLHDRDVRRRHRELDGTVHRWDDPPECDPGYRALPGAIFNCRCFPEAILPDVH